jgi:hypothetical protein
MRARSVLSRTAFGDFPDGMGAAVAEARSMNAFTLREHWLEALDTAAKAVDAAADAHALMVADCSAERRRISAEREWLRRFDWRSTASASAPRSR